MATVTFNGTPETTSGELPALGEQAPDFRLVNSRLEDISLRDYRGQRKLLNIVPSLDTPVCAESTRAFNRRATTLTNTAVLVISADLPFAQGRFCSTEGLNGVTPLSMMRSKAFADDYGVLIKDGPLAGLAARAVLVLDADDRVIYRELVREITREPDYAGAISALEG